MAYQSTPADRRWALFLGISYIIFAVLLAYVLFKIWPPTPWPTNDSLAKNPALAKTLAEEKASCDCAQLTGPCPPPSPTPKPGVSPSKTDTTSTLPPASTTGSPAGPATSPVTGPATASSPGTSPSPPSGSVTTPTTNPTARAPLDGDSQTSPSAQELLDNIPIKFFWWCIRTTYDERLILLVIIAGMLGSFIHGATSLADYRGNDNFNKNWTWFYLLRPSIGMSLALVFYFVVRGGFLTTSGGAKDINPYGIAALAGLVGMFSKQATDKLSEVFNTIFRAAAGEGDAKRKGSLKPDAKEITIEKIEPDQIKVGSTAQTITVTGANFVEGSKVHLNDAEQETTFVSATQLTAKVDDALLANAGKLKVTVVNPDKTETEATELNVS